MIVHPIPFKRLSEFGFDRLSVQPQFVEQIFVPILVGTINVHINSSSFTVSEICAVLDTLRVSR